MSGPFSKLRICMPPAGGSCPRCGFETEKDYTGARNCMEIDGGCGWSDYSPEFCTVPPAGWWCSRTPGHDGPCAARQTVGALSPEPRTFDAKLEALRGRLEAAGYPLELDEPETTR